MQSGQVSLAVTGDNGAHWFLINASPDLRQQIAQTPELHPHRHHLRNSPIAGVVLTNGEVDAVAGLLSLREGQPFGLYAHRRVLDLLEMNPIFNVLDRQKVPRIEMETGTRFEPALPDGTPSGLLVEAFDVPGKVAWYMEGQAKGEAGDTLGLTIRPKDGGPAVHILTACARIDDALRARLQGAGLVFFDGTLWTDDEMIRTGLSHKTGLAMGHISMSGPDGSIAGLDGLDISRKIFVHINNSNPALLPGSPERSAALAAGWELPATGQVFTP
jgi:pyrroloquinoline quinone biosynthesis protein B